MTVRSERACGTDNQLRPVQGRVVEVGVYESCGPTRRYLVPGVYRCVREHPNKTQIHKKDLQIDSLLEFDDGVVAWVEIRMTTSSRPVTEAVDFPCPDKARSHA